MSGIATICCITLLVTLKFVSEWRQVGGFLRVLHKTYRHDETEILLKVMLNIITLTLLMTT